MLNDSLVEVMTLVFDEEMFRITEEIVENYCVRGAIFITLPSRKITFASRAKIKKHSNKYPFNEDVKLLIHLTNTYNFYKEALVVLINEETQELIKIVKVEISTVKLNTPFRENYVEKNSR